MQRFCCFALTVLIITGNLTLVASANENAEPGTNPTAAPSHESALPTLQAAESALSQQYPGVRFYKTGARNTRIYGRAFSFGASVVDSAEAFRQTHAAVFGVKPADLKPESLLRDKRHTQDVMYEPETGTYKFTLVYYRQYQSDVPVFMADLRLLARNEAGSPVILASSGLRNLGGFELSDEQKASLSQPDFVSSRVPAARQSALATTPGLINFSAPEPVIWAGVGDMDVEPRLALTFIADNFAPNGQNDEKWLFVTDAESGEILYQEFKLYVVDGNASCNSTEGIGADYCEAEVPTPLRHLRITSGVNSTFTDENGDYTIAAGGGTVDATLSDGQWFDVYNFAGSVESLSLPASTPANFVFNAANSDEFVRAQSNGYVEANVVRDFAAQYNPAYPTFTDTDIPCWVNRTDGFCPGNAWYDPADGGSPTGYSINFCQTGGGYPNTAWSSVIYHEFGHHLVDAAGSGQGQYGEGTGDCMSTVILDDSHLGFGFFGTCDDAGTLRSADNTLQYPCSAEIHFCGQVIAGCVWDTRNQLVVTEPANYRDILGNLTVNAILLHTGSTITPQITIDWLTLDDDDANLGNGTPHYPEICAGFGAHNMDCPPLSIGLSVSPTTDFSSSGDVGGPFTPNSVIYTVENLGPGPIDYSVTSAATWLTITNGAGSLPLVGSTAQVTVSINANANALPQGDHTETINFTNTTDGVGNTPRFARLAVGIPDNCTSALVVCPGSVSDTTVNRNSDGSASCGTTSGTPDMWYSYTPDSNGSATYSLCGGTSYDSVLSVHSGCPGSSGNELGCDDDFCGGGGPSQVTLAVTAGTTYLIRVSGWNGSTGSFTLTITGPDCAATALDISLPGGSPSTLDPGVATGFDVQINDADETYVPGTGTLHYRYDGGSFLTTPLTRLGGNLYQATLPAAACVDTPEFYVSAEGDGGTTVTKPFNAPTNTFTALVGTIVTTFSDNFQTDQGWTAQNLGATSGDWQRGVPVNDPTWDYDPVSDADGSGQCYLTQNELGNTDVDGGAVRLLSPVIDMSGGGITISYEYFLRLTDTAGGVDRLLVEISSNGDAGPWTQIALHDTDGGLGWRSHVITQADLDSAGVVLTSNMKLRFDTNDADPQSINESGLDAFVVTSVDCNDVPCPAADGNMNGDADVNGKDLQVFVTALINGGTQQEICAGDFNSSGDLDTGDISGMVTALLTAP